MTPTDPREALKSIREDVNTARACLLDSVETHGTHGGWLHEEAKRLDRALDEIDALSEALGDSQPVAFISERNLKALAAGEHSKVWPPSEQEPGETALYTLPQRAEPASVQALTIPLDRLEKLANDIRGTSRAEESLELVGELLTECAALAAHPSDQNHSG